ncbi:MAG TPA: glycosyltransferase family 2 protein [Acidobacteriota bacterium]|nr:glycosyltransferase family 2 protein [Acidobacteriota bacterium]
MTTELLDLGLRATAAASLLLWLIVVVERRRWWPSQWSLHLDAASRQPRPGDHGELVLVIPARNEAAVLPRTLPRLLKQSDWYHRLVVVDDRSSDNTASLATRLAHGTDAEAKLKVISVGEPEPGWTGKLHAVNAGAAAALDGWEGDAEHQWILCTDADVLHPTNSLGRLLSKASGEDLDLVSVVVKQRCDTLWEWLLIPPFLYFFHFMFPFRSASDPRSRTAAAAGSVMLLRRRVFDDIGGLEALGRHIDELALARRIKRSGGKCWLGLDPDLMSLRSYGSLGRVRATVERTTFEQLRYRYSLVPVVWLGVLLMFALPPALAIYGAIRLDLLLGVPALLAWALATVNFLPVVGYLGAPASFALTLPASSIMCAAMATASAWRHMRGKPAAWRPSPEGLAPDD